MSKGGSDSEWEKFGSSDPYWAVLTNEKLFEPNDDSPSSKRKFSEKGKTDFFLSGQALIDRVMGLAYSVGDETNEFSLACSGDDI